MKKLTTLLFVLVFAGATAFAQNNDATVDQTGYDNNAEVEQIGSDNDVTLEQVHNQSNGTRGINDAYVKQTGITNIADVYQRNRGQYAASGFNNDLDLIQDGNLNTANTYQAIARGNDIKLDQVGDRNFADIYQHQGGKLSGYGSASRAIQNGEDNELYIDMGNFNSAGITQDGNFNLADIQQNSFSSDNVQLIQEGDDHEVLLIQSDGMADIQQFGGNNNYVYGLGGSGTYALQEGGSTMTVTQNGYLNELFIGQNAGTATVTQTGNNNTSTIEQGLGGS